jgi:hypothetical protein
MRHGVSSLIHSCGNSNSERADDFDVTDSPGQVMEIMHDSLDLPLAWDQQVIYGESYMRNSTSVCMPTCLALFGASFLAALLSIHLSFGASAVIRSPLSFKSGVQMRKALHQQSPYNLH